MNDATMRMCILFAITASGLCGEAVKLEKEVVLHGISSVGCRECDVFATHQSLHGRSLQNARLPQVERELLSAARDGDLEGVRQAIQSGATGNLSTSSQLFTPLIFAARGGYNEVVVLLLGAGVNPNWQTRSGITALWIASFQGHEKVVQSLLTLGNADIDLADSDGKTPLYVASQEKQVTVVRILLDRGANPEVKSMSGVTPLLAASRSGDPTIVELLADKGANVDPTSNELGRSALWTAAFEDHINVVKILIKKGASLDLAASDGSTPLFAAARQGWDAIASELVRAGADINSQQKDGLTPLHIAVVHGHLEVVQLLVQAGAGTMIRDSRGRTPGDLLLLKDVDQGEDIEAALGLTSTVPTEKESKAPSVQPVPSKVTPQPRAAVQQSVSPIRQSQDNQAPSSITPILVPQPLVRNEIGDQRVLHNPGIEEDHQQKGATTKIAIIIPAAILGIIVVLFVAFLLAKLSKPKEEKVERIETKLVPESENSYDVRNSLGALGDTHGSGQVDSMQASMGGTLNMIDMTFEEAGITPHRFGMETRRSHILLDGPSSLQDSARMNESAVELESMEGHRVSKTWNWASDDGPSDEAGEGGIVATYKGPHVPRPTQGLGLDSSLLHEELRLDHQITRMEREPWWKSSKHHENSEVSEDVFLEDKYAELHGGIRQVPKNSVKIVPATYTPAVHHEAMDSDLNLGSQDSDCGNRRKPLDDLQFRTPSVDFGEREVLGRRMQRSRSAELLYCMGDADAKKVSGSSVWMTAYEGAGAIVAGEEGDRSKRVIRVLKKRG